MPPTENPNGGWPFCVVPSECAGGWAVGRCTQLTDTYVPYLTTGVQQAMQQTGCVSVDRLHASVREGTTLFELRSLGAQQEGGVHHLFDWVA